MESREYQKIPGPFKRQTEGPERNKLIIGEWSSEELRYLADSHWYWTEKVDGTNIRVHWDGHRHSYGGRTDNAQIPAKLIGALDALFAEELFEQKFGAEPATLYGEGYGAGVQKGGVYRADMSFVLFDVRIGEWWLRPGDVADVAKAMGIETVPFVGLLTLFEAIERAQSDYGFPSAWNPNMQAEGVVGVTPLGLRDRAGHRLIVKVKRKDFRA